MKVLNETISQLTVPTPFPVGDVHVYLLKGDTLSLVDAGVKTKEAWIALKSQLKQLGYFPNDIEQIILTHHHPDHTGLIENFPRVENIVAHPNVDLWLRREESFLQYYKSFLKEYFAACGVPSRFGNLANDGRAPIHYAGKGQLTTTINEGDVLPGHQDWQVIETKGHAQSHLSFFRESDGLFIGGDHLLHHISSNPLLEPPQKGDAERAKPLLQYRANLKKCLSLAINTVLPGHGRSFSNVSELIRTRLNKQQQHADKVYLLIEEGAQTPYELCQKIFPKHYEKQLELTMCETIGQLDFLEDQGLIEKIMDDGIIFYHIK